MGYHPYILNVPAIRTKRFETSFIANSKGMNSLPANVFPERNKLDVFKARVNRHLIVFPPLENYHVEGTNVHESAYPWLARIVHSRSADIPHICTASCIDKFVFITASRCFFSLRVPFTTIIYNGHRFPVKAFVSPTPSKVSQQSYDDIGFIVVMGNTSFNGEWYTVKVYDKKRTDNRFKWFDDLVKSQGSGDHKAVGYAVKKRKQFRLKDAWTQYDLTELDVVILNLKMCADIYTVNFRVNGFYVPCYNACDYEEFKKTKTSAKCKRAHGAEGGVLYNAKTNTLFGIATWGSYYAKYELPVGFSVPNSVNYYADKECALKIRDDAEENLKPGYLQSLCPL